jgi:hypothetical protein
LKPEVDVDGATQEANATVPECFKAPEQEAGKSCSEGFTPASRPAGQKQKENREQIIETPSTKETLISLSSDETDGEGKSKVTKRAPGGERLRTGIKRGRPKKSQDFYEDVEEDDFSLFHKPRARNTPKRIAASEAEKKAKIKPEVKKEVPVAIPKSAFLHENVGHGRMRYQFVIEGLLEAPVPVD